MNRRLPTFTPSRFQHHLSPNSTPNISAPRLRPQQHSTSNPHLKSRLSPPIPLEELVAEHRRLRGRNGIPIRGEDHEYGEIVRRYVGSHHPHDAESFHLCLIKRGLADDLFLNNNLISLYARTRRFESAHKVFDQIPDKNPITWTCLIAGYTNQSLPDEACHIFQSMLFNGFAPTHYTFGSVLRACQDSGPDRLRLGSVIHGEILKTRYAFDTVVCNALISMYGSCCLDSANEALRVFESTPFRNSISWNSMISVHARRGDAASAFQLFSAMQQEGFGLGLKPNEYTFASLITAVYSCKLSMPSVPLGPCLLDQTIGRVSKAGFLNDLYVGSALVSAFARFGLLDRAKKIFLLMSERNAVSMNGLMVGLVKQNLEDEAVEVFREMGSAVMINSDSYVVLLSALADFPDSEQGKRMGSEVHGLVIKAGLIDYKVEIANGLVNMYAKCGAIEESCRVFEQMRVKDQVSWNTIISGLAQNGHFGEALARFCTMLRTGIMPSNFAIISSLSSCASMRLSSTGAQVHCDGVKLGLDFDVSVSNSLLTMYGECDCVVDCWKVFNSMPDYDQISWNSMIGAVASSAESVVVFLDMMRNGWKPNKVTFVSILAALSHLSILELSKQVHALVLKHGLSDESSVENALLSCYAKSGEMDACECLFAKMPNRNDVSWNSMVAGYIQNGLLPKAMDFVWFMIQNGEMDCFTFATVLSACASVAALERGMEVHAFGVRSHLESDVVVESALVDMYSKSGRIDYASKVFRSMNSKNEFSWNSMISGYARHGNAEEALGLFKEMQSGDRAPDHVTFVGVLSACSHAGLVDEGLDYFQSMSKDYGLVPRMEHYSCVVDILGRAGKIQEVEEFVKRMPMVPNILVWRTVLVACCRSKNSVRTELGKKASEMLYELEPQNPVNYVLNSHLYASRGRWDEVARARVSMKGASARKEAGRSWVTFRDGVHVFVAGDRSHPNSSEIYAELNVLIQKIRDAGYVPLTEFVLYDLEAENKEELLSYHSEKLAVAFALTRSSGLPIRIMKNLRVCGDCHSAFGFISKIVGRQIILRDSNRFHHFEAGKCSCGDYW